QQVPCYRRSNCDSGIAPRSRPRGAKMKRLIVTLVAVVTFGLWLAPPALGQSGGVISGKVEDRTGGALAGVRVVLVNVATQVEQATDTDNSGHYQFGDVSVGIYRLRVE